jgi:hypothetical protein
LSFKQTSERKFAGNPLISSEMIHCRHGSDFSRSVSFTPRDSGFGAGRKFAG